MRTKALLGLAALAASALTTLAQNNVYSLNVVGYYNIALPANGLVMIANQFNTANNTIGSLIPAPADGTVLYKYNGKYTPYTYDATIPGWTPDGNATLNPGEGAFIKSPAAATLTFVGEVPQGNLTNNVPIGALAMRSSIVPQAGGVSSTLLFPAEDGDVLYTYLSGKYTPYTYDATIPGWTPSEPSLAVGQAFFVKKATGGTQSNWVRNFTVQ